MFPLKDNVPTERFPVVTVTLIAINVLMFFLFQKASIALGSSAVDDFNVLEYGAIPYELTHPGDQCVAAGERILCGPDGSGQAPTWLTPFTSMFMHGGVLHIAGNMLFLWIFGNNVEDVMGRVRYVAFYLLGGIAALAAQVAVGPDSFIPTIGASGAVAGVLGGYLLLHPKARVITLITIPFFFTLIELPALLVLAFWFVEQVLFGVFDLTDPTGGGGGIAYFAHIGGFVFGSLAIRVFADAERRRRKDELLIPGHGDRRLQPS